MATCTCGERDPLGIRQAGVHFADCPLYDLPSQAIRQAIIAEARLRFEMTKEYGPLHLSALGLGAEWPAWALDIARRLGWT